MKIQLNFKQIVKTSGLLLTGILLGWLFFGGPSAETATVDEHVAKAHTDERGNVVYTCSMHPQIRQDKPGNCPICGMELIPVNSSGAASEENPQTLTMTPIAMKLADVETTPVVRKTAVKQIRMPGKVAIDEREISVIPAYFPGRIEELYLNFTGAYVEKGDKLASVYSPELITAQKELLEAYNVRSSNPVLYESARQKLKNWEISDQQIDQIIQNGEPQTDFVIRARQNGYVTERNVAIGDYVEPGKPMFKLVDLSDVWVLFQAYESDLMGLDTGDKVSFTVEAYPDREFEADVTYIDPIMSKERRTVSVRTEIDNESGLLKPNMLTEGVISASLYEDEPVLQVPKAAVLWTGERSIVYVKDPDSPSFAAREVVLGPRVGNNYVVKKGLKAGELVVIQGNFMIDSAAQLAGKLSMMNREPDSGRSPGMNTGDNMEMKQLSQNILPGSKSAGVDKAKVPDGFKEKLDRLVDAYLAVKDALTKDDLQAASSETDNLNKALSGIGMGLFKDDKQMQAWMSYQKALRKHIEAVEQAKSLPEFRKQFVFLSEALSKTLATFGTERPLYLQYCPMAADGEGATWISKQKKISNPYMGQTMPQCGKTQKSFGPAKDE